MAEGAGRRGGTEQAGGGAGEWLRLQQAFLAQCMGNSADPAMLAPWQTLAEAFSGVAGATTEGAPSAAAPWQSFKLFAELLGEQAQQLRAGRKRKVDVSAAIKALLESFIRNIDVAIAAQAMLAGDKAMGLASVPLTRAFADWPALGLTRDWQGRLQRCWQAQAAEREAGAHLRTLQWRALRAGCDRCSRALSAPGPAITSLRGLYDLLVDSVERAWRETAMTDEYARAFGANANATLVLRAAVRDCAQPFTSMLELAGRAELDAIDRRLRDLEARAATSARTETRAAPAPTAARPARVRPAVKPVTAAAKPGSPRRRAPTPPRIARKPAAGRAEFDIASMIARGDDAE